MKTSTARTLVALVAIISMGLTIASGRTLSWNVTTDREDYSNGFVASNTSLTSIYWSDNGTTATTSIATGDDLIFEKWAPVTGTSPFIDANKNVVRLNPLAAVRLNSITFGADADGWFKINTLQSGGANTYKDGFVVNNYNAFDNVLDSLGNIAFQSKLEGTTTFNVESGSLTVNSSFSDASGSGTLIKKGAGTLVLTQSNATLANNSSYNNYSGGIDFQEGTLVLNFALAMGSKANQEFTVDTSRTLIVGNGSGNWTSSGNLGTLNVNSGGVAKIYDWYIFSEAGGANVNLNGGTYMVGGFNNSAVNANRTQINITADSMISGDRPATGAMGDMYIGNMTWAAGAEKTVSFNRTANITSGNTRFRIGAVELNSNAVFNFDGVGGLVEGAISGDYAITKEGSGDMDLMGTNTFTGGIYIKGGSVSIRSNAAINNNVVTFTEDAASGSSLILYNNFTAGGLVSSTSDVYVDARNAAARTIGVNTTAGQSYEFKGVIRNAADGNATSFIKNGSGTQILSGTNLYSGSTTINAGELVINGSILNSAVSVNGGTLGGNGLLGTVTVNNGGTLAPGNSPGAITINSLTVNTGGTVSMEIANVGSFDQIIGLTTFAVNGGTLELNFLSTLTEDANFQLFSMDMTGNFTSVVLAGVYSGTLANSGGVWAYDDGAGTTFTFTSSTGILAITAIPEPATYATIVTALIFLAVALRRRRK